VHLVGSAWKNHVQGWHRLDVRELSDDPGDGNDGADNMSSGCEEQVGISTATCCICSLAVRVCVCVCCVCVCVCVCVRGTCVHARVPALSVCVCAHHACKIAGAVGVVAVLFVVVASVVVVMLMLSLL